MHIIYWGNLLFIHVSRRNTQSLPLNCQRHLIGHVDGAVSLSLRELIPTEIRGSTGLLLAHCQQQGEGSSAEQSWGWRAKQPIVLLTRALGPGKPWGWSMVSPWGTAGTRVGVSLVARCFDVVIVSRPFYKSHFGTSFASPDDLFFNYFREKGSGEGEETEREKHWCETLIRCCPPPPWPRVEPAA